jgi:phage baseplate assembly protein gpV
MLKFGTVTEINQSQGTARVLFDDVDIISGWLFVLAPRTHTDAESDPMEKDEHVACMMDENCETGVILGAIYDDLNPAPIEGGADKYIKKFKDNTVFKYDRLLSEYQIENGTLKLTLNRSTGFNIEKGSENLGKLMNDLAQECATMTMPVSGATAGPPTNALAITAIIGRINTFFIP